MNEHLTTPWRELAVAVYKQPSDSRIYGTIDVDVTDTLEYITEQRAQGNKITLTHMTAAALARSLYEDIPEINCYVRRGKIIPRKDADVFITVALQRGRDMTGVIVPKAQYLSASDIASFLREKVRAKRQGEEEEAFSSKELLSRIPWPFRRPLFLILKWLIFEMGTGIPFLNIPPDPFGSIMLSNIGVYGLTTGMAALFPIGKLPAVIVMGKVIKKPVVIKNEVKIRSILPLTGTFDHRIVDGFQAGVLARGVIDRFKDPQKLDSPILPDNSPFQR